MPGKPLLDINGKSLIQHVYESACQCGAEAVYIATDDPRIQKHAEAFTATVIMTSKEHLSGTDRLVEAVTTLKLQDEEMIINLQGDEMDMPAPLVQQVAAGLYTHPRYNIATLCKKIDNQLDIDNPNVVKVVFDQNNSALYFSRAAIPHIRAGNDRREQNYFRHIGLYAYRVGYLKKFQALPYSALEESESLEQLRALFAGEKIYIEEACTSIGIGIDTADDILQARRKIKHV